MAQISFDSEKELEETIIEYVEINGVSPFTNRTVVDYHQQLNIEPYGIADLMFETTSNIGGKKQRHLEIIELKNNTLKPEHIGQLARYLSPVLREIQRRRKDEPVGVSIVIQCFLVGPDIDHSKDTGFLMDAINGFDIFTFTFDALHGVKFLLQEGWKRGCEEPKSVCELIDIITSNAVHDGLSECQESEQ